MTTSSPVKTIVAGPDEFTPPKPTKSIKCGLRNNYELMRDAEVGLLWDPEDPSRFLDNYCGFGMDTNPGEFPWHVSLRNRYDLKTFCSGTLINSWTVLTAAHCLHEGGDGGYVHTGFEVSLGSVEATGGISILRNDSKFGMQVIQIDLREGREKGRVFVHPGFIGQEIDTDSNVHSRDDIAIIVLSEEVDFPENADRGNFWDDSVPVKSEQRGTLVRPICMPDSIKEKQIEIAHLDPWTFANSVSEPHESLWVTGFGKINRTTFNNNENKPETPEWKIESDQLQKNYYPAMKNPDCQKRMRAKADDLIISDKQICVMGLPGRVRATGQIPRIHETCHADSGGPGFRFIDLLYERTKGWSGAERDEALMESYMNGVEPLRAELAGVNSWEYGCGSGAPAVYTRVSEYMNWIKQYTFGMYTVTDELI